jgi:hypothetical protein
MTDFEVAVMKELGDIKAVGTATAQQVTSLDERLFSGPSSVISDIKADIAEIKAERKSDVRWEKIHNTLHYSLTPFVVGIHAVIRHFGINI